MERDRKALEDLDSVESPELTDKELAEMRPAAEVVPHIVARARKRGERGPQKAPTKQVVTIRLDREVLGHFRSSGPGWQTRVNDILKRVATRDARTERATASVSKKKSARRRA
jgi:uncharacterized protein (DUF4415 family)